jgi:hypothetical protein
MLQVRAGVGGGINAVRLDGALGGRNANARGRVRGLVESWEQSGSEGEDVFGGGGSVKVSTSSQADPARASEKEKKNLRSKLSSLSI